MINLGRNAFVQWSSFFRLHSRSLKESCASLLVAQLILVSLPYSPGIAAPSPSPMDGGVQNFKKHNYLQAIKDFESVLKAKPSDERAHYYLALSLMSAGQSVKSRSEFEWVSRHGKERELVDYSRRVLAVSGSSSSGHSVGGKPSVLDFGAVWCVPCKKIEPIFDRVGESYRGRVDFKHYDCDVGEGKQLADRYDIHVLPTILFMSGDGRMVSKIDGGGITAEQLIQNTEALLR